MSSRGNYQRIGSDDSVHSDDESAQVGRVVFNSWKEGPSFLRPVTNAVESFILLCSSFIRTNAGLLLVAASQGFFALMNVAVKKLNSLDPPVPPLELVAVRMGITYVCCISYMLLKDIPDPFFGPKGIRHLLVLRGFSGFFGLFGVYYSLQYLSLSDATVLTFLVPLTTAFAGYLFLGEAFHRREALAGVFSLIGVILIARPEAIFGHHSNGHSPSGSAPVEHGTAAQRLGAVGVALVGVIGATGAYTSIRAIGKRAHALHSMTYFSMFCVITSTIGMVSLRQKFIFPTRLEWLGMLVMIGIFGFLAQTLLTMGLQRETAGRGAMAIYVQIIFASILERIFFHTVPSAFSVIGTLIILTSAICVAIMKQATQPSSTNLQRDDDAPLDLEFGVAEPETQRFLPVMGERNISTASINTINSLTGINANNGSRLYLPDASGKVVREDGSIDVDDKGLSKTDLSLEPESRTITND